MNAALANPALRQTLTTQGYAIAGGPPESLKETVAADAVRWRKVMDASGFKPIN